MKPLNLQDLLDFIREKPVPVMETELLKQFFPHSKTDIGSLDFFRSHFNLYHYLYLLKAWVNQGDHEYIYIRLAYCYLFKKPHKTQCSFFSEDEPGFCRAPALKSGYCTIHQHKHEKLKDQTLPDLQGIESYYLNPENFTLMDQKELSRITSGVTHWMASMDEIEHSLNLLGLSESCTLNRLKQRFRYLAREFHPDKNNSSQNFHQILLAYERIKKWKEQTNGDIDQKQ